MYARMLTILLLAASIVRADAIIEVELVPDNPGPYYGGEELVVDVWLHNLTGTDYHLQFVQFDFRDSDPDVALDSDFVFDFSELKGLNVYDTSPSLPVPWVFNPYPCGCPDWYLPLVGEGILHIGSVSAQLPEQLGEYTIDAMNADDAQKLSGAQVMDWLDSGSPWRANLGEVVGDPLAIAIVPEGATLGLFGLALGIGVPLHGHLRLRVARRVPPLCTDDRLFLPRTALVRRPVICNAAPAERRRSKSTDIRGSGALPIV